MSEYEIANLAVQQAAITAGYWQTGITLAVSSGLVLYGFRIMRRGTEQRRAETTQQHTEAMTVADQHHTEVMEVAERRHTEVMEVAERRHTEVMEVAERRHTEAMKASEDRHIEAMKALQELIERTAPPR